MDFSCGFHVNLSSGSHSKNFRVTGACTSNSASNVCAINIDSPMMFVYSYDVCLLRCYGKSFSRSGFLQNEFREVLEHPVVFQRVINNPEKLAGQGDDGATGSAPAADALVVVGQIRAVAFGDEGALHERRAA